MTATYRSNKQLAQRRQARATELKMRDRWKAARVTVAQMATEFSAARLAAIATGQSGSAAENYTPSEIKRVAGLEFVGLIEPEAWDSGDIGDLITPSQGTDFSVSLAELKRGELVCILQTGSGDLIAVPYR